MAEILGIDVGGSGIKGAIVDTEKGELKTERFRIATPDPAKPEAVAEVIQKIVSHFKYVGPVGCGFPTLVHHGRAKMHSNLDPEWLGVQIDHLFSNKTGQPFTVINDADAAGLAEMAFGAGRGKKGVVIMITLGTGIGSGFFFNGELVPNFELGQLFYRNKKPIEKYSADSVRTKKKLSWSQWGKRLNVFLQHIDLRFSPDTIIIGGGVSKLYSKYQKYLDVEADILVAETKNEAGIIGAALAANKSLQ